MDNPIKTPGDTAVQSRYLVMPQHANPFGTAFGGIIMSWIDMVAAMAAQKHCGTEVVTVSIDSMTFEEPVRIGNQVTLLACVNYVGLTSMEVGVKVIKENPTTGITRVATKAYLTFVAVDADHKPIPAPPLEPKTDDDKRRWNNAALRVKARKELRRQVNKNNKSPQ